MYLKKNLGHAKFVNCEVYSSLSPDWISEITGSNILAQKFAHNFRIIFARESIWRSLERRMNRERGSNKDSFIESNCNISWAGTLRRRSVSTTGCRGCSLERTGASDSHSIEQRPLKYTRHYVASFRTSGM